MACAQLQASQRCCVHLQPSKSMLLVQAGGLHRQGSRERLLRRGAGDSPTYGPRPTSQPRSNSQPRTPSANPELVVNAPAVRKFLAQHQGELSGRTDQVGSGLRFGSRADVHTEQTSQGIYVLSFTLRYLQLTSFARSGSCDTGALHCQPAPTRWRHERVDGR